MTEQELTALANDTYWDTHGERALRLAVGYLDEREKNRRLTAQLAAVEAARDQQWQPIETAPKDGTTVLLDWSDETGRQIPPKVGRWNSYRKAWCDTHSVLHGPNPDQHPTHWQPLPGSLSPQPRVRGENHPPDL